MTTHVILQLTLILVLIFNFHNTIKGIYFIDNGNHRPCSLYIIYYMYNFTYDYMSILFFKMS